MHDVGHGLLVARPVRQHVERLTPKREETLAILLLQPGNVFAGAPLESTPTSGEVDRVKILTVLRV